MAPGRTLSADKRDLSSLGSLGAFNYNGPGQGIAMDEDVEMLEREIDSMLRRTNHGSAFTSTNGINFTSKEDHRKDFGPRNQTAGEGQRRRKIYRDEFASSNFSSQMKEKVEHVNSAKPLRMTNSLPRR